MVVDPRLFDARVPVDGSVDVNKLQDGSVTSSKLAALAVVAGKLAPGSINNVNLFTAGAVDSAAILDGTIVVGDIAASAKDAAAGTASLRSLSTTATTACAGNDARLSDTRTPTAATITQAMFVAARGYYTNIQRTATRTTADVSLISANWTTIDSATDLTIAASTGDEIHVFLDAVYTNVAGVDMYTDVQLVTSTNYMGTASGVSTGRGIPGWTTGGYAGIQAQNKHYTYLVQSGDISGGNVLMRLRIRNNAAGTTTISASTTVPLKWWAINRGIPV